MVLLHTAGCSKGGKKEVFRGGRCIGIYPGQYFDTESKLHYNYHRYYQPGIGRYLRADPIGIEGEVGLYLYVNDNPIKSIDPYGLFDFTGTLGWNWSRIGIPHPIGKEARAWENIARDAIRTITIVAKATFEDCRVTCIGKKIGFEIGTQIAKNKLDSLAEEFAWKAAKKIFKRLSWVSTGYTGFQIIECFIKCSKCPTE